MKVLFIDPDNFLKDGYTRALRQAGFDVVIPGEFDGPGGVTSTKAAEFVDSSIGLATVDLIITEQQMNTPRNWDARLCEENTRTGNEVIRRVRLIQPELPVIILTKIRDDADRERNQRKTSVYWIKKQETTPARLIEIVRNILDLNT